MKCHYYEIHKYFGIAIKIVETFHLSANREIYYISCKIVMFYCRAEVEIEM